jgi:putative endonuclease
LRGSLSDATGPFWVYILENAAGKFYIGSTEDLVARIFLHNDPVRSKAHYTAKHGPWRLVWSEEHATRSSAVLRERAIKKMKSSKWIREKLLVKAKP